MWLKFLLYLIIILFVSLCQITLLKGYGLFLRDLNLIIVVLVVLINLIEFKNVLWFVVISGLIMDIFSGLPFGIFLAVELLVAIGLEALFLNFFTNRSFYSLLIMGAIGIIFYNLLFIAFTGFFYLTGLSNFFIELNYWQSILRQLLGVIVLLIIGFYLINSWSKRFKPIFLRS
ncbi:MAG: hypothetical protein WC516_00555 [Patescibacteria group bacterium]